MSAARAGVVSTRHMQLIAMLARGYTTDRAARELCLSRHTVGEEISILLGRFNCQNRAELVAFSYVHRLLPIGVWPPPARPTPEPSIESGRAAALRGVQPDDHL